MAKDYYDYHPMSRMSLGIGFSPNDLTKAKIRGIDYTVQPNEMGAINTTFAELLVRNSAQLKKALQIDTSVDASFLTFEGNASFTYEDTSLFESDSLTMVMSARTEYGRLTMKDPVLTVPAKALIAQGRMKEFEETYGSYFVVEERRGANVSVILTVGAVSQEAKTKINTGVRGSGGWGPLSASAKATFQKEIQQASKEGRLNVQVLSTGGEGLGGLSDLVKALTSNLEAIKEIQNAIGNYIAQFNTGNSVFQFALTSSQ